MKMADIDIDISVYRSDVDSKIVIAIDTQNLAGDDVYANGVPRLTLMVNDDIEDLMLNGQWSADRIAKMPPTRKKSGDLTSEQAAAITYAYLDIRQCDAILNHIETCQHRIMEVGEAVAQTKSDLEKAFPFLLLDPNDGEI